MGAYNIITKDNSLAFTVSGYYSKKQNPQMVRTKKGRWFPVPSNKYQKWEKKAVDQINKVMEDNQHRIDWPINTYKIIIYRFYWKYGVHADFNNANHGICDALESAGFVENDKYLLPVPYFPDPFVKDEKRRVECLLLLDDPVVAYKNLFQSDIFKVKKGLIPMYDVNS